MAALLLDDTITSTTATPDQRRITEADPAMARLKARTARQLSASIGQLVDDLKAGVQPVQAQSHFIDRHLAILRQAYLDAHHEGQRDFYDATSNTPDKWATHEADTALMQRRMSFYAPSVARMAHEAVRAFQTVTHAPAQFDEPAAADDTEADDEAIILYGVNRDSRGRYTFGKLASGGGSHGESQHAGAGHVGEHVGAERGHVSIHSTGFGHGGGDGGGGSGMAGKTSTPEESARLRAARVARARAKQTERRAAAKTTQPLRAKAAKSPDEMRAASRTRSNLHNSRYRAYKREDILSGDHVIRSYHEFSFHAHTAARANDTELMHALSINRKGRRLWTTKAPGNPNTVAYRAVMAQRHAVFARYQETHAAASNEEA